jgi:signal transduction histidine kinase
MTLRSRRLPALSVRWRLTLWYLAILALILLVFGTLIYETQASSIRSQMNDDLRRETDQIAATFDPASGQFNLVGATPVSSSLKVGTAEAAKLATAKANGLSPGSTVADGGSPVALGAKGVALLLSVSQQALVRYGNLSDPDVKRLTTEVVVIAPPHAGSSFFTESLARDGASDPYRFYTTPILVKDILYGTLVVGEPDRAPAQLRRLLLTLALVAPVTLLLATAGGYWLATRAMRPVRAISSMARGIGATDLSQRLNLPDRDELGELAATFDQMLERLEAAFQRQRQFTSDASHELRTPLTIVQLELEHALASGGLAPETERALRTIRSENEAMARLVDDLLTLARADSGRAVLEREPLDLSDVVLDAVERLAGFACEHAIVLRTGELPEIDITGDRLALSRMLRNIIENAIRYTSGHGRSVLVETGTRTSEDMTQGWVRVRDDGPGIAAEHLPHLFERFYRVNQARSGEPNAERGGSGLGLSIAQWIATSHGGDIRIESTPGCGTTVEIWLPHTAQTARMPSPSLA